MKKLDIANPHKVEAVWALLRPRNIEESEVREIIATSFYHPPKSKKGQKLLEHITINMHKLLTKHPNAGIYISGDINELNIKPLIDSIPKLKQLNFKPTYKDKCLDIILSNLSEYYGHDDVYKAIKPHDAHAHYTSSLLLRPMHVCSRHKV